MDGGSNMISETHNRLFDNLLKTSPDVLKRYLQEANLPIDQQRPGTPPLYLVAAALQGQREKALAGSPQPGNQPTVAQQLVSEAAPPPTSQMPGPPQLPPAQNPPAPAPIEQGIAALPTQEPNYAHGGVVSFAGGDFIEGFGDFLGGDASPMAEEWFKQKLQTEQEPELTPEEMMQASRQYSTPYRDTLKNWGGGDMTPKAPPKDPLAGVEIEKYDPRKEMFDMLGLNSTNAPGAGSANLGGIKNLQGQFAGILGGPADELSKLAQENKPKEMSETLAQMQEARRLAGVNQGAYDAQRAKEMADYESDIAKNVGMQEKFAKAKAWGALADTKKGGLKGLLSAASNAMNTYAEGMTGVMNYDTENKMLLRKMRMAQADQDYARKFNDSNALLKARQEEEDAYRELQIKATDAKGRMQASALSSAVNLYNRQIAEEGANARQKMSLKANLIKAQDLARTELAKTATRYKVSMAQLAGRTEKDRALIELKLRQDPTVLNKASIFAEKNPNMKINGKTVDPIEYFLQGYAREFFLKHQDYTRAAMGGGSYMTTGAFDGDEEPIDIEPVSDFGYPTED